MIRKEEEEEEEEGELLPDYCTSIIHKAHCLLAEVVICSKSTYHQFILALKSSGIVSK